MELWMLIHSFGSQVARYDVSKLWQDPMIKHNVMWFEVCQAVGMVLELALCRNAKWAQELDPSTDLN